MKPMCELFAHMLNTGNGILERFTIIIPDCRKVDPDVRDAAYQRMERKGIMIEDIYRIVMQLAANSDPEFNFSDEALR